MLQLTKGGPTLNLTKNNGGLRKVDFALGWSPSQTALSFDLDAFVIGVRGKSIIDDDDVLYYNSNRKEDPNRKGKMLWIDDSFRQPYIWNKAMVHSGDELTGGRDGDDEVITATLASIPAGVTHLAFCVDIFDAVSKKQNFGMVNNSFIRLDNQETGMSIAQYDLHKDAGQSTGVVMGYLERSGDEWDWHTLGQGFNGDMNEFCLNIHKIIGVQR
jgi:tellurium resistance protein TerD